MSEIMHNTNELLMNSLKSYSLAEIVHHVFGNGLTIISGYTQILLREMTIQEINSSPPNLKKSTQQHEKQLSYLRAIRESEEILDDFLIQLRDLSLSLIKGNFNKPLERTDIVPLCKPIIEKLELLCKDHCLQIQLPIQPIYVMCNLLWMMLILEHIATCVIASHKNSTPVFFGVEEYTDHSDDLLKARIIIHIAKEATEYKSEVREVFERWQQTLNKRDNNLCMALCNGILGEYRGKVWLEPEAGKGEVLYVVLPAIV